MGECESCGFEKDLPRTESGIPQQQPCRVCLPRLAGPSTHCETRPANTLSISALHCSTPRTMTPMLSAPCKCRTAPRCGGSSVPINSSMLAQRPVLCSAARRDDGAELAPDSHLWVFQAEPPRGNNYSLLDVRDAVEACSAATDPEERQQCFLNFGLKAEAVDEYYPHVMKMEEMLVERPSEEDLLAQRMVRVAGFFLCLVVGCKVV